MNTDESLRVLRALAEGVDPDSYQPLATDSPLQRPQLIRAFFSAASALEQRLVQERRRSRLPQNAGHPWSPEEDEKLKNAFEKGDTIQLIAGEHLRTFSAIKARLIKLGKITDPNELF